MKERRFSARTEGIRKNLKYAGLHFSLVSSSFVSCSVIKWKWNEVSFSYWNSLLISIINVNPFAKDSQPFLYAFFIFQFRLEDANEPSYFH
jgi:hypothetical protein